jgi:hypothetical protein
MDDKTIFESFDAELMDQMGTRRDALRGAGMLAAGLAMAAVPGVFASLINPRSLFAQAGQPTVTQVLEFALTLEYLEWQFYEQGLQRAGLIPAQDRVIFEVFRDHELAHVRFLEGVLGLAQNARLPNFDFSAGGAFANWNTDYGTYRALAQGFEDTGVRAYKGQAPNLMGNAFALTAALQIHAVEGRHASMIRRRNGDFSEMAPQKGWITGAQTGAVPAMVGNQPVGNAIYGPGTPAANFPSEANVTQGGVNVTTLTFTPQLEGDRALKISESFDEPLDMATVNAIAGLFIRSS